jgi:hypothetical protein
MIREYKSIDKLMLNSHKIHEISQRSKFIQEK